MSVQSLAVFYRESQVGKIYLDLAGVFCFEYTDEWRQREGAFALSHSLPLERVVYTDAAETYFANLLPEGKIRRFISKRLGVSEENDFALLRAMGEDCAGAFTLLSPQDRRRQAVPGYEQIDLKKIARIYEEQPIFYLGLQQGEVRLSLAGAQDKVALYRKSGRYYLPRDTAASSHILKFPSKDYTFLTENEYFISQLAQDCDLNMMPMELLTLGRFTGLLVERYDRISVKGSIERLHQEDFCQALAISHKDKYEEEGGPSFRAAFELVEQTSASPLEDLEQLLKWLVFNVCVGNCDHHGKNLSLLMNRDGQWHLSPFYDLLCTRVYRTISKKQAMSIGGSYDGANMSATNWQKLCEEINYSYQKLQREIALPIVDVLQVRVDEQAELFKGTPAQEFIKTVAAQVKSLSRRVERSFS